MSRFVLFKNGKAIASCKSEAFAKKSFWRAWSLSDIMKDDLLLVDNEKGGEVILGLEQDKE